MTKNVAKFAVYEETIISVKNHQNDDASLIEAALKIYRAKKKITKIIVCFDLDPQLI